MCGPLHNFMLFCRWIWGYVLYPSIENSAVALILHIHRVVLKYGGLIHVCQESHLTWKTQNCAEAVGHRRLGRVIFLVKDATSVSSRSTGA